MGSPGKRHIVNKGGIMNRNWARDRGRRPNPSHPLPQSHQDVVRADEAYHAHTPPTTREAVEALKEDV
jgi:hypothetical protein